MPLVHSLLTGRTHEQFGDRCPDDIAIAYKLEIRGINNVLWKPHANKMVASNGLGFRSENNESTNQLCTTVHPNNVNLANLERSFEIGRATCRDRDCHYVKISAVAET